MHDDAREPRLARAIDEILARIDLSDHVLDAFAKRRGVSAESLDPKFVKAVRIACMELDVDSLLAPLEERRERPKPVRNARRDAAPGHE